MTVSKKRGILLFCLVLLGLIILAFSLFSIFGGDGNDENSSSDITSTGSMAEVSEMPPEMSDDQSKAQESSSDDGSSNAIDESSKNDEISDPFSTDDESRSISADSSVAESFEAPSKDESVGTPSKDESVGAPSKDESVGTPSKDESIGAPSKDESIGTPSNDESIGTPSKDESVGTPSKDESVGAPSKDESVGTTSKDESKADNTVSESTPFDKPAQITILKPVASGKLVKQNASAIIDYSNTKDGYVMVKFIADVDVKLKVQVKGPTTTYTYNIIKGEWTVFPLSDGNGTYSIKVYKNAYGTKYSTVLSLNNLIIDLDDEYAPFIRPNQYVNYENAVNTMEKASVLLKDSMSMLEKVETIYNYVTTNIKYDYEKAATAQSGYLPDLDHVLKVKKGICFDYAALMTGMLRSQNIPCKLVVGYANTEYHAWISVYSPETGWVDGVIYFNGVNWQQMDPTFASGGNNDLDKISYTTKYIY